VKLHSDSSPGLNTVTGYDEHGIEINRQSYAHAIFFAPEGEVHAWAVARVDDITAETLRAITGLDKAAASPMDFLDDTPPQRPDDAPEVVLVGTGARQHLLSPETTRPLLRAGIGVEAMSTHAAARTYNILMAEGRRVLVALLPQEINE